MAKHSQNQSAAVQKTNVARLLDQAGIAYRLIPYEVDPDNLAASHVAECLGEDIERVFKTLVLKGEYPGRNSANANAAGYFVCVVPGNTEVDLKAAAKEMGAKKAELIPMKDLLGLTGYIRGGCSPIGMKRQFPTIIDETAILFDTIFVSAGVRGLQIEINPEELAKLIDAKFADIGKLMANQ